MSEPRKQPPMFAPASGDSPVRTPIQVVALVFGMAFLLVGALGFVPGVTTRYDQLTFAGHHSGALLFGVFMVSVLHNVVHLLYGVAGVVLARRTPGAARGYLLVGGAIYLLLWLYGLLVPDGSEANLVPVNTADNWLHLGLALSMLVLGVALSRPGKPMTLR